MTTTSQRKKCMKRNQIESFFSCVCGGGETGGVVALFCRVAMANIF